MRSHVAHSPVLCTPSWMCCVPRVHLCYAMLCCAGCDEVPPPLHPPASPCANLCPTLAPPPHPVTCVLCGAVQVEGCNAGGGRRGAQLGRPQRVLAHVRHGGLRGGVGCGGTGTTGMREREGVRVGVCEWMCVGCVSAGQPLLSVRCKGMHGAEPASLHHNSPHKLGLQLGRGTFRQMDLKDQIRSD